ncbi:hypothetical protein [Devosia sp. Naph2]|uniref:hypothetical protein n=1 Tax=Devosia polycyclovorans TaxID=3345148 RepID=UPI0035D05BBC
MIANLDWTEPAELYAQSGAFHGRNARYFRFSSAAEAIRFAIEDMPAAALRSMAVESGDNRYEGNEIRALYDAQDYPLERAKR